MSRLSRTACFGVGIFLLSSFAFSAVIVKQESGEVGGSAKMKITMYVDNGKIRVETVMATGRQNTMIFDGDKQVLWMIPGDGSYTEMTAATMEQMSRMASQMQAQMQTQMPPDAMKQMQDRLASLPPEQRAMAEQAMKGRMGAMQGQSSAPVTITFKEKASGQRFGSFTCTLYDELRNGERAGEVCAASLDQAHFGAPDVKTFEALAKFMEPMKRMAPQGSFSAPPMQQLHGFPVHSVSLKDGHPSYEVSVLSIEQKSADPSLFAVPAGLTKKDMMGGRGQRY